MSDKIKQLLMENVITIEEVLAFSRQYTDAKDTFDERQLMMSDWECMEGTLHSYDDVCNCTELRIDCENDLFGEIDKTDSDVVEEN
jgi:hypothetical protein